MADEALVGIPEKDRYGGGICRWDQISFVKSSTIVFCMSQLSSVVSCMYINIRTSAYTNCCFLALPIHYHLPAPSTNIRPSK
jgi:hypothetical protein